MLVARAFGKSSLALAHQFWNESPAFQDVQRLPDLPLAMDGRHVEAAVGNPVDALLEGPIEKALQPVAIVGEGVSIILELRLLREVDREGRPEPARDHGHAVLAAQI